MLNPWKLPANAYLPLKAMSELAKLSEPMFAGLKKPGRPVVVGEQLDAAARRAGVQPAGGEAEPRIHVRRAAAGTSADQDERYSERDPDQKMVRRRRRDPREAFMNSSCFPPTGRPDPADPILRFDGAQVAARACLRWRRAIAIGLACSSPAAADKSGGRGSTRARPRRTSSSRARPVRAARRSRPTSSRSSRRRPSSRPTSRFMQGMIHHHAQALRMTALVPKRTGGTELPPLAERMDISQKGEIEQMQRWLREREQSVPVAPPGAPPRPRLGREADAGHAPRGSAATGSRRRAGRPSTSSS